ncbi:hypothetical protein ISS05_01085 [Candidatus Woesearchaeota archaeon]|nr:hypothetical protein [Candidatus Woesearchaeota archaeon]
MKNHVIQNIVLFFLLLIISVGAISSSYNDRTIIEQGLEPIEKKNGVPLQLKNSNEEFTIEQEAVLAEETFSNLLQLKSELYCDHYSFDVKNKDLAINSSSVLVGTPKSTMILESKNPMYLVNFRGRLIFNNSLIVLKGNFLKLEADYTKLTSDNSEEAILTIKSGDLIIKDVSVENFNCLALGTVEISNKASFNLAGENFAISNFFGDIAVTVRGYSSFTGTINSLLLNFKSFEAEFK